MPISKRVPAAFAILTSIVSWASAPVFIRFLRDDYDPYSQAFIRYGYGALALAILCMFAYRAEFLRLLARPGAILGVACLNVLQQCTWTVGCYGSTATMAQLLMKLNVVFVIIFSFLLFHEERAVVRSPFYLLGTLFSFAGLVLALTKNPDSLVPVLDRSTLLLLFTSFCWAVYIIWAKHIVTECHPVPMFAVLSTYTTVGFGIVAFVLGEPRCIIKVDIATTLITLASGLFPIALAHPTFHYGQKYLGSAFSASCNLLTPFVTYVFAVFVLDDEYLTVSQWVGAATLIVGTAMVVWVGHRAHRGAVPALEVEA